MKNRKISMILSSMILTFALVCSGCGGEKKAGNDGGSTGDAGVKTQEETAEQTEESVKEETPADQDAADTADKEEEQEEAYTALIDTSNERVQVQVIGAEKIQRGADSFLRVYLQRKNLSDKVMYAQYNFITNQDDGQLYATGRGYTYLEDFSSEEGLETEEDRMNAMDYLVTRGNYLMPGVTKQNIVDIKLKSDSEVKIQLSCGSLSDEQTWDLDALPGPPSVLKRTEQVTDPEKWKAAVVNYSDTGTIQPRRVGELGFTVKEVTVIDDPAGHSPSGKLIQLTSEMTNSTEKEQKAEKLIEDKTLVLMMQDGVNLWDVSAYYKEADTVLAPGETGEVKTYFQPLSDSPVFVVFNGAALSGYTTEPDKSDNFGMEYTLGE